MLRQDPGGTCHGSQGTFFELSWALLEVGDSTYFEVVGGSTHATRPSGGVKPPSKDDGGVAGADIYRGVLA